MAITVPNAVKVTESAVLRELTDAATEYAGDEDYALMGPVVVDLQTDENLKPDRFRVSSRMLEPRAVGYLPSFRRARSGPSATP